MRVPFACGRVLSVCCGLLGVCRASVAWAPTLAERWSSAQRSPTWRAACRSTSPPLPLHRTSRRPPSPPCSISLPLCPCRVCSCVPMRVCVCTVSCSSYLRRLRCWRAYCCLCFILKPSVLPVEIIYLTNLVLIVIGCCLFEIVFVNIRRVMLLCLTPHGFV